MNKQDEEKALSIAEGCIGERTRNHPANQLEKIIIRDACLEMAAWKEQQMIEKAKEFISTWFYEHPHTSWLICSDEFQDLDNCLERLEKEMKEEN